MLRGELGDPATVGAEHGIGEDEKPLPSAADHPLEPPVQILGTANLGLDEPEADRPRGSLRVLAIQAEHVIEFGILEHADPGGARDDLSLRSWSRFSTRSAA